MTRRVLTDAQWAISEPYCLGKTPSPGQTVRASWLFVEAVLWVVRTAAPWRELPGEVRKWNPVFKRVRRRVEADAFHLMLTALSSDADFGSAMIDGTIVKGHRSGQGSKGGTLAKPSMAGRAFKGRPRGGALAEA